MDRLTEMEAFATVVDQGGFTDAAKKMGISKSAVSKHVSALEARLGARLLNRTTRRVSPTEIGLAYYDRARRVLNDAGEADALVTSMQSAPSGLLRVSVATDFGVNLLSPILGDFLLEYPDITVNMVLNNRYVEHGHSRGRSGRQQPARPQADRNDQADDRRAGLFPEIRPPAED
jgi:DNA-binding transcriptional LysR family regulator